MKATTIVLYSIEKGDISHNDANSTGVGPYIWMEERNVDLDLFPALCRPEMEHIH